MNVQTKIVLATIFLALSALCVTGIARAQVSVDSATPNFADQGTVDLDVEITGSGFSNDTGIAFYVHDTDDPGGITVKKAKAKGRNKVVATIDVALDATISDFDIEAYSLSGNGRGRGTSLFSVRMRSQGQGANTGGIVTFLTQEIGTAAGVFSDQLVTGNHRYVSFELDGTADPQGPGVLIGDCATVVLPTDNGVDNGKAQLFVRDVDGECPLGRWILVRGSGFDLDGDSVIGDELVHRKLMCFDTFDKDTSVGDTKIVTCQLFVETIDENGRVDRTWRIDWNASYAEHVSDDVRIVTATDADVYQIVPSSKGNGNGKKEVVFQGQFVLPMKVRFERVRY